MVDIDDNFIHVTNSNGIYTLSISSLNVQEKQIILSTNLHCIIRFAVAYLKAKFNGYMELESLIGNLGELTLSTHISQLIDFFYKILLYAPVKGLYFESFLQNTDGCSQIIDTLDSDITPTNEFTYFIDSLYANVLAACLDTDALDIDDVDDDKKIDFICSVFLDKNLINILNNYYQNKISTEDMTQYLNQKSNNHN